MILALITAVGCLLLFVILFLIWPWLETQPEFEAKSIWTGFSKYQQLFLERESLIESLKDLEVDFQMGKLNESDRQDLRQNLSTKLMSVLKEIEEMEKSEAFFQSLQRDLNEIESAGTR